MFVLRWPLSAVAGILYALGYTVGLVTVRIPKWIWAAIRLGWEDAR